ncbi:MAG: hypothetical protein QOJ34_3091 [Pseudonocardiales bacterium]|nr:hypothetical protein [Pseudonocardiales bacterium]
MADERGQAGATRESELPPTPEQPAPPPSRSDAVLARYRADMRRSRIIYAAIVAVIVAGLGTWVGVAWSRGEISHASLHTFAPPPPSIGVAAPTPTQQVAWRTPDRIALGEPQYGGTVITYSVHTVGGRDARTGARTWYYTRSDRTVCTAAQLSGTVIAVYANKGNCDELSAFDSDTGRRRWTRTLDMDGMPLNGRPSYQVTASTMLITSNSVIYAIDPVSGYNRWTYYRYGCSIEHVVLGGAGALISQNCSAQQDCHGDTKFCKVGAQLTLRNGVDGRDDDKANPDQIIWSLVGNTDIPVSADDQLISAVDEQGTTLHTFDTDKGTETGSVTLTPATDELGPVSAVSTSGAEIVWLGGQTYAIADSSREPLWRSDSAAPPTVISTTSDSSPLLATARITVAISSGIGILDGNDGRLIQQFTVGTPQRGSLVYSLGDGFLVAGTSGVIAYR